MQRKCINCGEPLKDDAVFCTKCGAKQPIEKKCPNCGAPIKAGMLFCTKCGAKIKDKADNTISTAHDGSNSVTTKISKSKIGLLIGVGVVILLVFIGVIINSGSSDNENASGGQISVKAEEMADDYIRDQASAEQKYKNKKVQITGTLADKGQFKNSQDYSLHIYNKYAAGKSYHVIISVDSKKVNDVNKIKVGDFVTAQGTCVGIVKQDEPTQVAIEIDADKVNE